MWIAEYALQHLAGLWRKLDSAAGDMAIDLVFVNREKRLSYGDIPLDSMKEIPVDLAQVWSLSGL